MLHIVITHTYTDITSYDYDIIVKSGNYTANMIINEVVKYADKQGIKCRQVHELERCYIITGLTQSNQLWQATIKWGLTSKEIKEVFKND